MDENFASLQKIFWIFFAFWPILVPIGLLILLINIRTSVVSGQITKTANACRFLWEDYDHSLVFWDILDIERKIFLVGFIMFLDQREGSNKSFRLLIAGMVSLSYLVILLAARPYLRNDNYYLALVSNFLLVLCFMASLLLKVCSYEDGKVEFADSSKVCDTFFGLSIDSDKVSLLIFLLTLGVVAITITFMAIIIINKVKGPKVIMNATGYAPNLELSEDCKYHIFFSHVWATGQAKAHAIVRKLQLTMPGLRVWLDIDKLQDLSLLKDSIAESVVFVMFYSAGYFHSQNCCHELQYAFELGKPMIIIYEGEQHSTHVQIMDEFMQYFDKSSRYIGSCSSVSSRFC
jgi:hypothetical protein